MHKSKFSFLFAIILAAMLATSCEKVVDFDPGEVEPYVVMISKPVGDSLMSVYLGYSRFFLDDRSFNTIDNATVTLTIGGTSYTGVYDPNCFMLTNYYENDDFRLFKKDYYYYGDTTYFGGYTFVRRPAPGDTLRLTATVPGRAEEVTAMTTVPPKPTVEIIDYVVDTVDESAYSQDRYFRLRFRLYCNSNKDYFNVKLHLPQRAWQDTTQYWDTTNTERFYFSVNDPIVNDPNIEDVMDGYDGHFEGSSMSFSSERFTGGYHDFTLEFYTWNDSWDTLASMPVWLSVGTLSEELYRYNVTSAGYSSGIDNLFSEPVQVYCNIKGGIGIVGASTSSRIRVAKPRFENFHNSMDNN